MYRVGFLGNVRRVCLKAEELRTKDENEQIEYKLRWMEVVGLSEDGSLLGTVHEGGGVVMGAMDTGIEQGSVFVLQSTSGQKVVDLSKKGQRVKREFG